MKEVSRAWASPLEMLARRAERSKREPDKEI